MNELLLDGSQMPAKEFYKRFVEIVRCTENEWINKDTTKIETSSDWYEFKDDNFILGGTAYSPPKLYKIVNE